jgi:hypothetical protein
MPIVLTLPDGATREVEPGTLARDVVATIGSRLLRDAIAVSVDGEVQDLMTPIRPWRCVHGHHRKGPAVARRAAAFRRAYPRDGR